MMRLPDYFRRWQLFPQVLVSYPRPAYRSFSPYCSSVHAASDKLHPCSIDPASQHAHISYPREYGTFRSRDAVQPRCADCADFYLLRFPVSNIRIVRASTRKRWTLDRASVTVLVVFLPVYHCPVQPECADFFLFRFPVQNIRYCTNRQCKR